MYRMIRTALVASGATLAVVAGTATVGLAAGPADTPAPAGDTSAQVAQLTKQADDLLEQISQLEKLLKEQPQLTSATIEPSSEPTVAVRVPQAPAAPRSTAAQATVQQTYQREQEQEHGHGGSETDD